MRSLSDFAWNITLHRSGCVWDAAIYCGGFARQESLPEVDPLNFAPHVKVPVLTIKEVVNRMEKYWGDTSR